VTRRPLILFIGEPVERPDEGGGVGMFNLTRQLGRLSAPTIYCASAPFTNLRRFAVYVFRSRLLFRLLNPFYRRYLISPGHYASEGVLRLLTPFCVPLYFHLSDEPRLQFSEMGIEPQADELEVSGRLLDLCLERFRFIGAAAPGLAELYPQHAAKFVEVSNAAEPSHFVVRELPERPVVALVGSTSPGRGADLLIEACARARREVPALLLRLALNDISGRGNLGPLKERYGSQRWISFETVDYDGLPDFLAGSRVCVVPHRRGRYADLARTLKIFDYMAAGRPVVTTDCPALAAIVTGYGCGLVCRADPADMAAKIARPLLDGELAAELGGNGRSAVESELNWSSTTRSARELLEAEITSPRGGGRPRA
jgi:glycosyltransferase involved in cell wall biosynthesis